MGSTLLLLGVTACWGWTFVLIKDVVSGPDACPVMPFLFWRFLIAGIVLLPVAWRRVPWGTLRSGGLIGLALAGGYALQTVGLRWTTPTNSALVTGLFLVFAAFWARLFYREPIPIVLQLACALSLTGLVLLTGATPAAIRAGDALTLLCAACYGLHIAWLSRHAPEHDVSGLTLVQMFTVAVVCGLLAPLERSPLWPPRQAWPAIGITAIFASALAFLVQTHVQRRLSAVRAALILSAEPVFGVIFGHLLWGDRLRPIQWLGAVLICAALAWGEGWRAMSRSWLSTGNDLAARRGAAGRHD